MHKAIHNKPKMSRLSGPQKLQGNRCGLERMERCQCVAKDSNHEAAKRGWQGTQTKETSGRQEHQYRKGQCF